MTRNLQERFFDFVCKGFVKGPKVRAGDPAAYQHQLEQYLKENRYRKAPSFSSFLRRPKGVLTKEVIDVGVRGGTGWLYKAIPDADFVLVDPQPGGEALLKGRPKRFVFVNSACGAFPSKMTIREDGGRSSFLCRTELTARPGGVEREVEVTTLDAVIDAHCKTDSIGLKIDTEGFELEVLNGLVRNVEKVGFIVAEISVRNRFERGYNFSEAVTAFAEKGFLVFNILNFPRPSGPNYLDVLFLPCGHPAFD